MSCYRSVAHLLLVLLCLSAKVEVAAQTPFADKAYAFYTETGEQVGFEQAMNTLSAYDIVLFGEHHDHALIHWLQLRTTQALAAKKGMILGGEMWEADNQLLLDEYLMGLMTDKVFEEQARLWPNYKTDYKPLMEWARKEGVQVWATNVPRRYASLVAREGLDTLQGLPAASQVFLPKLPIPFSLEIPGYQEMIEMMGGGHGMAGKGENFVRAQALKDATMAGNIGGNAEAGKLYLHFNGDFHSAQFGGIYWYLKEQYSKWKVATVKIFAENYADFQPEWAGSGTLILVVPADFTKTH